MFNRLREKYKTQKVFITVTGSNFKEDLQYLKYNLRGQEGLKDLEPIKHYKLEILRESPLSVMLKCNARYNLKDYLDLTDVNFEIME